MKQRTVGKNIQLSGVGLHAGINATIIIKPALMNTGIAFCRVDQSKKVLIPLTTESVVMDQSITRCTALTSNGASVLTVEHLLAAFHGLGIDNAVVEIDQEEIPGMDGSSRAFMEAIKQSGIIEQEDDKHYIKVTKPITVSKGDASVTIVPAEDFRVSYTLDYDYPGLQSQTFETSVTQSIFETEIAPARTFCLETEIEQIRSAGLGKGANEHNTLVMGKDGPIGNTLRFADECARHKALDIVGDLFLLGKPVLGHVTGVKSGHALNRLLVAKIMEQNMSEVIYDINDIMKILPHRYPFLLVDRVTIKEKGKRGVGLKNVTINDGFFAGHFPERPVMPGVLMIEALAQTAGVVVLTSGAHPDKVALFMSIDGVKFRRVVAPGDQLILEVEIIRDRERTAQVKGVGKVDGDIVVEAEMLFSYTDIAYLKQ